MSEPYDKIEMPPAEKALTEEADELLAAEEDDQPYDRKPKYIAKPVAIWNAQGEAVELFAVFDKSLTDPGQPNEPAAYFTRLEEAAAFEARRELLEERDDLLRENRAFKSKISVQRRTIAELDGKVKALQEVIKELKPKEGK